MMGFAEIDLCGVYVAPITAIGLCAWIGTAGLRWLAVRFGLLNYVWHPSAFVFGVFVIVLSTMTLLYAP